jgi:glucose/arabinose dehydrogenase
VYYNTNTAAVIARYTANPASPESASSPLQLLAIPRSPGNHNGGWIGFSLDGFLYIASGDATNTANAQSLTTLLGKMIRINPNYDDFPADPERNYRVPIANPFYGSASALPEIWAFGLRNPWRNSFDRIAGDLWIADVGNARPARSTSSPALSPRPFPARNYGWPCMDGSFCRGNSANCTCGDPVLTAPVFDYDYAFGGNATVGGYVYRGNAIPALQAPTSSATTRARRGVSGSSTARWCCSPTGRPRSACRSSRRSARTRRASCTCAH